MMCALITNHGQGITMHSSSTFGSFEDINEPSLSSISHTYNSDLTMYRNDESGGAIRLPWSCSPRIILQCLQLRDVRLPVMNKRLEEMV